jgi:diaminohydroxyphosphoribosylaminopyrimidine deaminase/5-amino-6-(5-phosphoribosylamino)uracil reductase
MNEKYMRGAISIAQNARKSSSPNPAVGAIIVKGDTIIGSGFTQLYGSDHAEVQAIKSCTTDPAGSTMYVTLEPCSHIGKTPPCTQSIISAGIKKVYIGILDPNPIVHGNGVRQLQKAGIHVEYPFFSEIITKDLEFYIKWITTQTPFIIMKNAVSLDGKIAAENGSSKWITSEKSREKVHNIRASVDAILTTINTLRADDPILTVRYGASLHHNMGYQDAVRVVLDPLLDIDLQNNICKTADKYNTIIYHAQGLCPTEKINALTNLSIKVIPISYHADNDVPFLNLNEVLTSLAHKNITSVLVEAGATLCSQLMRLHLVDKIYYFISPKILGGSRNVYDKLGLNDLSEHISLHDTQIETIESDVLIVGYPVYHKK